MELINCTPHDVVIFTPYGGKKTIKASGDVARLREILWPCFYDGGICFQEVSYGDEIEGLPPAEQGKKFIVSRVTAAACSRGDLVFPIKEVRDDLGRIIGCRGLGFFQ